jgi:hypothetical protein
VEKRRDCDTKEKGFFVFCFLFFSIPPGRIHAGQGSLLKVREERYKGKHSEAQVEAGSRESKVKVLRQNF